MENTFDLNIFKEKFKKSRKSKNERLSTMVRLITEGKDLPADVTQDEYNYILTLKNISKKPAGQKVDKPIEDKKVTTSKEKFHKTTKKDKKEEPKIDKKVTKQDSKEEVNEKKSTNKKESSK